MAEAANLVSQSAFMELLGAVVEAERMATPAGRIAVLDPERLKIHPDHDSRAAKIYRDYTERLVRAVREGDRAGFDRIYAEMSRDLVFGGYSVAKPVPTQRELWLGELLRYGYNSNGESDLVFRYLKAGERIVGVNWWHVRTDQRSISREDIRRSGFPYPDEREMERWLRAFTPIPTHAEIERQAESDPAIKITLERALAAA